jgi:hypothetical protein
MSTRYQVVDWDAIGWNVKPEPAHDAVFDRDDVTNPVVRPELRNTCGGVCEMR